VEKIFATTEVGSVCNLYGPTETTTYSTWTEMRRGEGFVPHIGGPIGNTRIYILDGQGEPSPIGVAGEIYIGGAGVARGYLNRPELTAERFVSDRFAREANARMYKTGDLGRWREDGTMEFLGRNDHQVKVRGFRIELGEIEAKLSAHPGVREAVVVAREGSSGDKQLVAYFTRAVSEEGVEAEGLRGRLIESLPEYMVPAAYVELEAFPLTPNGKLDRKALPAPEAGAYAARVYEAPRGEIETALAAIWAELLKVERVSRHDNFFELGGHSLLATKVILRIRKDMMVEIGIRDVFVNPALSSLSEQIIDRQLAQFDPIELAYAAELVRHSK
jgi:acyl-CoA synthetase (AMP-forming)/AMP-acid ligase II